MDTNTNNIDTRAAVEIYKLLDKDDLILYADLIDETVDYFLDDIGSSADENYHKETLDRVAALRKVSRLLRKIIVKYL